MGLVFWIKQILRGPKIDSPESAETFRLFFPQGTEPRGPKIDSPESAETATVGAQGRGGASGPKIDSPESAETGLMHTLLHKRRQVAPK